MYYRCLSPQSTECYTTVTKMITLNDKDDKGDLRSMTLVDLVSTDRVINCSSSSLIILQTKTQQTHDSISVSP